jgi:hypothetical protein
MQVEDVAECEAPARKCCSRAVERRSSSVHIKYLEGRTIDRPEMVWRKGRYRMVLFGVRSPSSCNKILGPRYSDRTLSCVCVRSMYPHLLTSKKNACSARLSRVLSFCTRDARTLAHKGCRGIGRSTFKPGNRAEYRIRANAWCRAQNPSKTRFSISRRLRIDILRSCVALHDFCLTQTVPRSIRFAAFVLRAPFFGMGHVITSVSKVGQLGKGSIYLTSICRTQFARIKRRF